jgi:Asp-tRNA(Asn)/Glu-tRNA(Gln) amidotransferase A subunit family amidase
VKAALARKGPGGPGRNLAPFNHFGWPALSMPCGLTRGGLPVGVQLVAGPWQEGRLLALAAAFQGATGWHRLRPRLG